MFVLRTRATRGKKNTEEGLDDLEAQVKVSSMPLVGLEQVLLFLWASVSSSAVTKLDRKLQKAIIEPPC